MSKLNPFSYLPSRSTIMGSLLYLVILIVKFGFILYDNELPGRQRNAREHVPEDAEVMPDPSTVDVPKSFTPKRAASITGEDEFTNSHHVLFRRAVACGEKQTNAEKKNLIDASAQHVAAGNLSDSSLSGTKTGKNTIDIPSAPSTPVNTPTDHAWPVDAKDDEEQRLRAENAQLKSSIVNLAKILSQEKTSIAEVEERAAAAADRATAAEGRAAAANAEADLMRVRLQILGMQRDTLPSEDEAMREQDQPSNDIDQAQDDNSGVGVPLDAEEHAQGHGTREVPIEEAAGAFPDVTEDGAAAGLTTMAQEALLSAEIVAHRQTREELAQLKEEMGRTEAQLEAYRRLSKEVTDSYEQLWGEQNNLQTQLDEANFRISDLEVSNQRLRFQMVPLQRQIEDLTTQAAGLFNMLIQRDEIIRKGSKELKFFIRLGTELHARVKKAEKMLKGALGRADSLMRLAELWLPIRVLGETYFGDIVDEDVDTNEHNEPKVQLAIEGLPAGFSAEQNTEIVFGHEEVSGDADIERLVSDMFEVQDGTAVDDGNVEAEGPASNNSDFLIARDVASPGVPTATSEDMPKESGFRFSLETPAQETRQETGNTAKKPVFAFGGTPAQPSRQEANSTATLPVYQFSATPVQETRQEIHSEVKSSPQGFSLSQQIAAPDVSGVQAAENNHEGEAEGIHIEDRDSGDGGIDQMGNTGLMLGNHEVTRDHASAASANQPDTPKAEENAQDFKFGATSPLFGAQKNLSPVVDSNVDSSSFNFASATDFNFGTTTTSKAGSNLFTVKSKAFC